MLKKEDIIYLDHNATTPVAPEALEAMLPYLKKDFGNPSNGYLLGMTAKKGVENARKEVASLIGCKQDELIFTSGGSESNNIILKGIIDFKTPEKHHIITSAIEHPAILNPLLFLMELGVKTTILPVNSLGQVDPEDVRKAIKPDTTLISIMLANNETGVLQPIKDIAQIAKDNHIPFHTDAAQAIGKISVDVNDLGVDFLSMAGHKLYAPKGIGALFIRKGQEITPLIHGAGQEQGKRAGTENVALSVGLGASSRIAEECLHRDMENINNMRDMLQDMLTDGIKDIVINGSIKDRLPNTLSISIPHIDGSRVLSNIPGLYASTGAACHDRTVKLSHVLAAMSVPPEIGMGTIRLSIGRDNTMLQMERAAKMICESVNKEKIIADTEREE